MALKKKLTAALKTKGFADLADWIVSVINHLYWSVTSSEGNADLAIEKWTSVCNHVAEIHEHDGPLYKNCTHGEVDNNWLERGTYFPFLNVLFDQQV